MNIFGYIGGEFSSIACKGREVDRGSVGRSIKKGVLLVMKSL